MVSVDGPGSDEVSDYWAALPSPLVEEWSHLRETPPPHTTLFLRYICDRSYQAERSIRAVRRMLASVFEVCRLLFSLS
jgi:hypothetical protein